MFICTVLLVWLCQFVFSEDVSTALDEKGLSFTLRQFANNGGNCVVEIDLASLTADNIKDAVIFPNMDTNCALVRVIPKASGKPVPEVVVQRRGALFICLGGDSFDKYLHRMRFQTLHKLIFAEMFHYNFYIYFRPDALPGYTAQYHRVPAFLRIFRLGHPWAVYVDMDTFQILESSVRLESFVKKDINLAAETPLCSGVIAMRSSMWSLSFLSSWWDLAGDDQAAMTHLLARALQRYSSVSIMFKFTTDLINIRSPNLDEIPRIQKHPNIHFIGEGFQFVQHDIPKVKEKHLVIQTPVVQLHNCLGNWPGCSDKAASFYHTGSFRWFWPHRLVHNQTLAWLDHYQRFRYENGLDIQ